MKKSISLFVGEANMIALRHVVRVAPETESYLQGDLKTEERLRKVDVYLVPGNHVVTLFRKEAERFIQMLLDYHELQEDT